MSWVFMVFGGVYILSFLMALSSNNWFIIWGSLEMNMLSFIPFMLNKDNLSINSAMKYFIVQSFASSILIFSLVVNLKNFIPLFNSNMIILVTSLKLGLAPFHTWFPQVAEGLSWASLLMLSTLQKIIPMFILSSSHPNILFYFILITSCTVGPLGMLSTSSLRKLLTYSSITHMAWMMYMILLGSSLFWVYLIVYSVLNMLIMNTFYKLNMSSIKNLKNNFNPLFKFNILISFLSLSGLPPFLGFFPKWLAISSTYSLLYPILLILICSSLISSFIYIRLIYPLIFENSLNMNNYKLYTIFMGMSMNLILLIPLGMTLFQ